MSKIIKLPPRILTRTTSPSRPKRDHFDIEVTETITISQNPRVQQQTDRLVGENAFSRKAEKRMWTDFSEVYYTNTIDSVSKELTKPEVSLLHLQTLLNQRIQHEFNEEEHQTDHDLTKQDLDVPLNASDVELYVQTFDLLVEQSSDKPILQDLKRFFLQKIFKPSTEFKAYKSAAILLDQKYQELLAQHKQNLITMDTQAQKIEYFTKLTTELEEHNAKLSADIYQLRTSDDMLQKTLNAKEHAIAMYQREIQQIQANLDDAQDRAKRITQAAFRIRQQLEKMTDRTNIAERQCAMISTENSKMNREVVAARLAQERVQQEMNRILQVMEQQKTVHENEKHRLIAQLMQLKKDDQGGLFGSLEELNQNAQRAVDTMTKLQQLPLKDMNGVSAVDILELQKMLRSVGNCKVAEELQNQILVKKVPVRFDKILQTEAMEEVYLAVAKSKQHAEYARIQHVEQKEPSNSEKGSINYVPTNTPQLRSQPSLQKLASNQKVLQHSSSQLKAGQSLSQLQNGSKQMTNTPSKLKSKQTEKSPLKNHSESNQVADEVHFSDCDPLTKPNNSHLRAVNTPTKYNIQPKNPRNTVVSGSPASPVSEQFKLRSNSQGPNAQTIINKIYNQKLEKQSSATQLEPGKFEINKMRPLSKVSEIKHAQELGIEFEISEDLSDTLGRLEKVSLEDVTEPVISRIKTSEKVYPSGEEAKARTPMKRVEQVYRDAVGQLVKVRQDSTKQFELKATCEATTQTLSKEKLRQMQLTLKKSNSPEQKSEDFQLQSRILLGSDLHLRDTVQSIDQKLLAQSTTIVNNQRYPIIQNVPITKEDYKPIIESIIKEFHDLNAIQRGVLQDILTKNLDLLQENQSTPKKPVTFDEILQNPDSRLARLNQKIIKPQKAAVEDERMDIMEFTVLAQSNTVEMTEELLDEAKKLDLDQVIPKQEPVIPEADFKLERKFQLKSMSIIQKDKSRFNKIMKHPIEIISKKQLISFKTLEQIDPFTKLDKMMVQSYKFGYSIVDLEVTIKPQILIKMDFSEFEPSNILYDATIELFNSLIIAEQNQIVIQNTFIPLIGQEVKYIIIDFNRQIINLALDFVKYKVEYFQNDDMFYQKLPPSITLKSLSWIQKAVHDILKQRLIEAEQQVFFKGKSQSATFKEDDFIIVTNSIDFNKYFCLHQYVWHYCLINFGNGLGPLFYLQILVALKYYMFDDWKITIFAKCFFQFLSGDYFLLYLDFIRNSQNKRLISSEKAEEILIKMFPLMPSASKYLIIKDLNQLVEINSETLFSEVIKLNNELKIQALQSVKRIIGDSIIIDFSLFRKVISLAQLNFNLDQMYEFYFCYGNNKLSIDHFGTFMATTQFHRFCRFRVELIDNYQIINKKNQYLEQFEQTWNIIKERVPDDKREEVELLIEETEQMLNAEQTERGFANLKKILFQVVEICQQDDQYIDKMMGIIQNW